MTLTIAQNNQIVFISYRLVWKTIETTLIITIIICLSVNCNRLHPMYVKDIKNYLPLVLTLFCYQINWVQFFTEFIGKPIDPQTMEIIVLVPTYIRKLNQKIVETKPRYYLFCSKIKYVIFSMARVLANYLIWKVVYQYIPLLSKRWREPIEKYLRFSVDGYRPIERWETCLRQIQTLLPYPLGNIYMKKHFNKRKDIEVCIVFFSIQNI